MEINEPTLRDVIDARRTIAPHIHRTPLGHYPALSRLIGAEVYVKHENHQVTGAFKARGGVHLIAHLSDEERRRGVATASTGNHAQSIAYGAKLFGVDATIAMPEGANPGKVQAVRDLGGTVIFHGKDFDEAREHIAALAKERGLRYIHSANEPHLISGVGTATLEILEDLPGTDVVIVPVGGGSSAAGACVVAKAVDPAIEVVGVQAEMAPAAYRSWKEGRPLALDLMKTAAEGLATRVGFELTQAILRRHLDDFVLVAEDAIEQAVVTLVEKAHTLAEGAGAASLAAALAIRERLAGKNVVLFVSGGNISPAQLRRALAR
ncbi:MAG: threonine/serine dehydratase [Thermoanaerobaculia bacterium]